MSKISPARRVAFRVLEEVAEGAYASDALREQSSSLDARDAGLASQIVMGSLRYQGQLDYLVGLYSGRRAGALDRAVAIALRTAIFQLRYLERIPVHAAVNEAVEFVKQRKRAAAGLVNAVLRKVTRGPVTWPNEETELSCPECLLERWRRHFGAEQARAIAAAALVEPAAYVRVRPGEEGPGGIFTERTPSCPEGQITERNPIIAERSQMTERSAGLTERSQMTERSPIFAERTQIEGAWRLRSAVPEGMRLHDISSQAIVPLLGLAAGQRYLDLCAAPGNKTLQALEMPLSLAVACDVSERRLREVPPICPRVVLDATRELPFSQAFDRIFIDAPCSGTGTIGRNPEIKWRVQPADFDRFASTQTAIVAQALKLLAPGGRLLYATCSLEEEENEQVIGRTLEAHAEMQVKREMWRLPGRDEGDGFYAAVLTRR